MGNTILGANTLSAGGYNVSNSLRVDDASNDFLQRSISSAGSGTIWTASAWFKRSVLGQSASIYCSSDTSTNHNFRCLFINADDRVQCGFYNSGYTFQVEPSQLLRDMSAWYHIVTAVDATQSTAANRVKIWINGVLQTDFSTASYPNQNASNNFAGTDIVQLVSSLRSGSSIHNSGYIAELHVLDGVVKQASDFGEYDEDSPTIWKPKEYDGTYGTNGFYMEFQGNGTSQNSSGLGADTSGNDNHFSVSNLTATAQSTDTCTNNFATLNPLIGNVANLTLTEGNLNVVATDANYRALPSTLGVAKGKWYAEFKAVSGFSSVDASVGVYRSDTTFVPTTGLGNYTTGNTFSYGAHGKVRTNNGETDAEATFTDGDIIQVAMDLDNNKLYFGKNNTYINSGDPESGSTGTGAYSITASTGEVFYFAVASISSGGAALWSCNFGSPAYANSSDASDANGYGAFEFAPPSGYYALNSKNLAEYG